MKASQLRELIRELIKTQVDEMSTTGALVQPGGQQIATTKAFTSMRDWKKVNKNRKWEESVGGDGTKVLPKEESVNESWFTKKPIKSSQESSNLLQKHGIHATWNKDGNWVFKNKADEKKAREVLDVLDESVNESYRKFKKKVTNPRQQMNNSVREIEKHLREVDRIVEYNLKLKTEMDLGGGNFFEGTNKRLARISERINHLNNKLKELGN